MRSGTYVRIGSCPSLRYFKYTLIVLDRKAMKTCAKDKNDHRPYARGPPHRVAETRDQNYTQLRPILSRPPGGGPGTE